MFRFRDCAGPSGAFFAAQEPTNSELYNAENLVKQHLPEDTVSSVLIPYGYSVRLNEYDGFQGESVVINGGLYTSANQEMQCINLVDGEYDFEDKTSSLSVFRTNHGRRALGYWKSITATEGIDYVYHVGIDYSSSVSDSYSAMASLSVDLEAGMDFKLFGKGVEASVDLSATVEGEIAHDTTQDMSHDVSIDLTIKCTGKAGAAGGVGLWQFVVENGDESVWTQTNHTVCRYGSLYNESPKCPWNACANGDCSVCEGDWQA